MPAALIEVRKPYPANRQADIVSAVNKAMMDALKLPATETNARLLTHEPHCFAVPPGKEARYTFITIDLIAGRSLGAKKALYLGIVEGLGALGIPRDCVEIVLREVTLENWSMSGVPLSEVELGFEVNV